MPGSGLAVPVCRGGDFRRAIVLRSHPRGPARQDAGRAAFRVAADVARATPGGRETQPDAEQVSLARTPVPSCRISRCAGLESMARTLADRRRRRYQGARILAGAPTADLEGERGQRSFIACRRGQQSVPALAHRRTGSCHGVRAVNRKAGVAADVRRAVHDEPGCKRTRKGAEVDTSARWRQVVHVRDQRRAHSLEHRVRSDAVAHGFQEGLPGHVTRLWRGDVADRRGRRAHRSRRRARQRRDRRDRSRQGRGSMDVERRRACLFLARRRRHRGHPAGHHAVSKPSRRPVACGRQASVADRVQDCLRPEHRDACGVQGCRDPFGNRSAARRRSRVATRRGSGRPNRSGRIPICRCT